MAGRFLAWLEGLRMLLRNIAVTCLPNDDSLKCAGIVYMRKGEGGSAGLAALHPLQSTSTSKAGYP